MSLPALQNNVSPVTLKQNSIPSFASSTSTTSTTSTTTSSTSSVPPKRTFFCTCGEIVAGLNSDGQHECLMCHATYPQQQNEPNDHDGENNVAVDIVPHSPRSTPSPDSSPESAPMSPESPDSPSLFDLPPLEPADLPPLEKCTSAQIKRMLRMEKRAFDKQRLADIKPRKPTHSRSLSAGDTPERKSAVPLELFRAKHRSISSPAPLHPGTPSEQQQEQQQQQQQPDGPNYKLFFEKLEDIREVEGGPDEREELFVKKLKLCRIVFDFAHETEKHSIEKEKKRSLLLELVDYITSRSWFTATVFPEIMETAADNLFRSLPYNPRHSADYDDDEPRLDPSWPHLQLVYELLLRFVVSNDTNPRVLKQAVSHQFIVRFLALFESDDPRERGYVQTILHRIYGKCMPLRGFIRRAISDVFYRVIYETNRHNGAGELLEILGSIINGFALPIKAEHKWYLRNVLIPLHKVESLQLFHKQLVYCVAQFVYKDHTLAPVVLGGLLSFWPIMNPAKEVLFLSELEEILELTRREEFHKMLVPLFLRLKECISSQHFQVAERALFLWNNETIGTLITEVQEEILPIIYPALEKNFNEHWNEVVRNLTANILKMLEIMDGELLDECRRDYEESVEERELDRKNRLLKWNHLQYGHAAAGVNNGGVGDHVGNDVHVVVQDRQGGDEDDEDEEGEDIPELEQPNGVSGHV